MYVCAYVSEYIDNLILLQLMFTHTHAHTHMHITVMYTYNYTDSVIPGPDQLYIYGLDTPSCCLLRQLELTIYRAAHRRAVCPYAVHGILHEDKAGDSVVFLQLLILILKGYNYLP